MSKHTAGTGRCLQKVAKEKKEKGKGKRERTK